MQILKVFFTCTVFIVSFHSYAMDSLVNNAEDDKELSKARADAYYQLGLCELSCDSLDWKKAESYFEKAANQTDDQSIAAEAEFELIALRAAHNDEGLTALHLAAQKGDVSLVTLFCGIGKCDPSLNAQDKKGNTPLHWASIRGHIGCVKFLLDKGADIHKSEMLGLTPLHCAADKGHREIVELLIAREAAVDALDNKQNTPLHWAADRGHVECVSFLLDKDADLHKREIKGLTPLHWAADKGRMKVIELLIARGAVVDALDKKENTPLHWAADRGHVECVSFLLDKGAKIDFADVDKLTALHWAIKKGRISIVEFLIKKDVKRDDASILYLASQIGNTAIIGLLIDAGFNINGTVEKNWTPLHTAAAYGRKEAVELLLEKGAHAEQQDNFGRTAVHYACENKTPDTLKVLIHKGVELGRLPGKNSWTTLHVAAVSPHEIEEIIDVLLSAKPDLLNQVTDYDETALFLAIHNERGRMAKKLIASGAEVNRANKDGWAPLHAAAVRGQNKLVELLLENNADKTARLKDGRTAAQIAEKEGHKELAELLTHESF